MVLLDFWATWCGACNQEMASLEGLAESLRGRGVQIWSVTEENAETAKSWLAERERTLPTVIVPEHGAFRSYGIDSLPQVVLIERNGSVAHQWAGLKSENDLRRAIEQLLDK